MTLPRVKHLLSISAALAALCGGILNATDAAVTLQSPNYPNAPSIIPLNCRWVVSAPPNKNVRVTVTAMSLQSQDCSDSYLQVRDQPLVTQVSVAYVFICYVWRPVNVFSMCIYLLCLQVGVGQDVKVCGSEIPQAFDSRGTDAQINFKYTGSQSSSDTGFSLTYAIASTHWESCSCISFYWFSLSVCPF